MKKIVSLIILVATVLTLSSCGDRKYDEEEVYKAAVELLPKSEMLNEIFWGKGIPHFEDTSTSNGYYFEAAYSALKEYGFSTIAELEALTRATFSSEYSDNIIKTCTSSISDESGVQILARYYQKYTDEKMTEPECIMVYTKAEPLLVDSVKYNYDSIKVSHSKKKTVYVTVDCLITTDSGKTQEKTLTIGLIEEADGWRIDTPSYARYDRDYYDKVENKED